MKVIPTDLLDTIVSELDLSYKPLSIGDKRYRPTVFQVKKSKQYVCCFIPVNITPSDFFKGINTQYENYLQGGSTNGYIFFKHEDPVQLKESVAAWYRTCIIN